MADTVNFWKNNFGKFATINFWKRTDFQKLNKSTYIQDNLDNDSLSQPGQENQDTTAEEAVRTVQEREDEMAKTWQHGQNSWDRTTGTRQREHDSNGRIARARQPGQVSLNWSAWEVSLDRTDRTVRSELDNFNFKIVTDVLSKNQNLLLIIKLTFICIWKE